jgi:hypothetical protein
MDPSSLFIYVEGSEKTLTNNFETNCYGTLKTNVGWRADNFFCDIERYVSDDQAYNKLSGKDDW